MKSIYYFAIFLFFLFFLSPNCFAETIDLGFFTPQELSANLDTGLTLEIKNQETTIPALEVASWLKEEPLLSYTANYKSEIENGNFCAYKKSTLCKLSFSYRQEDGFKKKIFVALDTEMVKKSIATLAGKVDKNASDSRFKVVDGKVSLFSLSEKGLKLDEAKSLELILTALKNKTTGQKIDLPYAEIDPAVTLNSTSDMGINTLLGEGQSNFRGSPKNRILNINVAIKQFDGILIKPGEEFSFVKALGEVDGEHGYFPELVIKGDKTEPDFGGGICQVSTTAFRAAIYSGLKITARTNHAYPVGYYNPQGMDATVYVPRPDLKFLNNTPGYILIQVKIVGTILTFDFYGTSDGRRTNIIGPTITERNPDGSMKATFTQQIYDKDNNLVREDVFKSNYESSSKFPHPGQASDALTSKPKKWSDHEWNVYKAAHGMN
ncbi:MAG: VanW family protein [Candidatus Moranbacteria bacterium]|nr:VanW family protein [Candidatus Moranbacteria bacterium]